MRNKIIPLGSLTTWSSESTLPDCSKTLASWLHDPHSLTQKLERQCDRFSVDVKQQIKIKSSDRLSGYFKHETTILVREVFLCCDDIPVVFAQTEIPFSTLSDAQMKLTEIGAYSLGNILFQEPSMQRGKIETTEFKRGSLVHQAIGEATQSTPHSLWARRSLFYINNHPLLVSEVFLPASDIYGDKG